MKQWILKHPFWAFYVVAISFPTVLFTYVISLEIYFQGLNGADYSFLANFMTLKAGLLERYPVLFHHKDSVVLYMSAYVLVPLGMPMLFFPFAPTVAAVVVTALGSGKQAVKNLLSLYRPFQGSLGRQEGLKIYAGILAFIAAMTVLVWFREYQFGDEARAAGFLTHLGIVDVKVFLSAWVMALFLNQGGLLEELGWRGYALPLLTRRLQSPLVAVLLVGVAWALWHFPREIAPLLSGQQNLSGLVSGQALFILSCCSMSVVASYFVNITGGSVLPAIMVHGTFNMVGGMFSTGTVGVRSELGMEAPIMWLVAALAVLLFAGPDLGWKRRLLLRGEAS